MVADAPETAKDMGNVGAEHATEYVKLVDYDDLKPHEKRVPLCVPREKAGMHHLGVRENDVCVLAYPGPFLARGIAVIRASVHLWELELGQAPELVMSERFRRVQK